MCFNSDILVTGNTHRKIYHLCGEEAMSKVCVTDAKSAQNNFCHTAHAEISTPWVVVTVLDDINLLFQTPVQARISLQVLQAALIISLGGTLPVESGSSRALAALSANSSPWLPTWPGIHIHTRVTWTPGRTRMLIAKPHYLVKLYRQPTTCR